jgi:tripartite-type tricarboxylate transporter receptor subunit TctC
MIDRMGARRVGALLAAVLLVPFAAGSAQAQDPAANYPSKPIRMVVGFAAGGGNDVIARLFADKMFPGAAGRAVVENKTGAGGIISAEAVARSAPDGYTLLASPPSIFTVNPAVYAKLPYDPTKDFVTVSQLATLFFIFVVNKDIPAKNLAELATWMKANPNKSNWGGSAATFQLLSVLFKQQTGVPFEYIQYRASSEVTQALISGDLAMTIVDAGPISAALKNGNVRALAVTAKRRHPAYPDIPTVREAGYPLIEYESWTGIFAPAATPPAIVKKLEAEFARVAKLPEIVQALQARETTATGLAAEPFSRQIAEESTIWQKVARDNNIRFEQ